MDQTTIDDLTAQRFVHYLITPVNQWEAFKLGLIDENGKVKRVPQNPNETKFFNLFHILALRLKDLLRTSGRGTNWVIPSTAGEFYLKNKAMPATNFTNWNIANRSSLPIFSAAYSAMKESINSPWAETTVIEAFEYYLENPNEDDTQKIENILSEEAIGNVAGQVANYQAPLGSAPGQCINKYTMTNAKKQKKSLKDIMNNLINVVHNDKS